MNQLGAAVAETLSQILLCTIPTVASVKMQNASLRMAKLETCWVTVEI